ncbi:transposable element Tcb1 transposase [Trichonephila clavipes]|nr:transposable element Tcb1 transposase [Trichonephila clavipes]
MGKAADLSNFDRGQIVMARRLGKNISETARVVGCLRSTVVSTYAKWMNDGETSSRRHGVGHPHAIKEKSHRRLSRMVKQNRSETVACNVVYNYPSVNNSLQLHIEIKAKLFANNLLMK